MSEYKVGDTIYLNGTMDGRVFYDTEGRIESMTGESPRLYHIEIVESYQDGYDRYWYVRENNMSRKPLISKELEKAGITKFWAENNIK